MRVDEEAGCLRDGEDGLCELDCVSDREGWDTEEAQANLAPHVQAYLARTGPTTNCCGFTIPIAFERAAAGTWWNPKFDSEILEEQYRSSSFRQIRLRFRFALTYILIFSLSWFTYFITLGMDGVIEQWPFLCGIFVGVFLATAILLLITFTKYYRMYTLKLSLAIALALCTLSLSLVTLTTQIGGNNSEGQIADVSQAGHFTICIEILLIIYTVTPLPLYLCVIVGILYSIVFEMLNILLHTTGQEMEYPGLFVRILLQLSVHLIGVHVYLMTFVRMRGTFMKVGQSLLVRRQLEMEKQLKEKMIHSVMPPKLATWLMKETGLESEINLKTNLYQRNSNPGASDLKSLFRPFNMNSMDSVSILFADIVGFTRMSSNKSAEELVSILNDLFERFDELCKIYGCEKISTLGDCYYCVSGCPEPRPDHAICCVEMGLGMIDAIREFDTERGEGVNMRVGVHTGTVLCGIVGTRRFKFDVWSNDVTLANKMESTGQPGRVHVSEETARFLSGSYVLEEADDVCGHKTYFIEGRLNSPLDEQATPSNPANMHFIISPASSPQSASVSPLPLASPRGSTRSHAPIDTPPACNNFLSPNPYPSRMKASSLPSILDSDTECDDKQVFAGRNDNLASKSPTSVGSYGKYTTKIKNWKVPKFLRKHSDTPLPMINKDSSDRSTSEKEDSVDATRNKGYQQVPIVIESKAKRTPAQSANKLNIPAHVSALEKEIIDIRSYLSQSRSNMSPFARTSSYRSQYGRPHHHENPVCRARSSTITTHTPWEQTQRACEAPPGPRAGERVSRRPSIDSRKDSGIPGTSRRSSIQQQIFALNQSALVVSHDMMQHRVSGYYTSSQSSVSEAEAGAGGGAAGAGAGAARLPAPLAHQRADSLHKLRKQSDLQLIRCVQENSRSGLSYFVRPPLSPFTLFFKTAEMERQYRSSAHRSDDKEESPPTLATSRFNTALDILLSCIIFLFLSAALFMLYDSWELWLGWFALFVVLQTTAVALCVYRHYVKWKISKDARSDTHTVRRSEKVFKKVSDWYPWHVSGSILLSIPMLAVLINFSCVCTTDKILNGQQSYYVYLLCIGIVHFCNFTQMNWLVKNCLVTMYVALFLGLTVLHCPSHTYNTHRTLSDRKDASEGFVPLLMGSTMNNLSFANSSDSVERMQLRASPLGGENVSEHDSLRFSVYTNPKHDVHLKELYIAFVLLLMLVWFLNREFEISYRLSFHSNVVANRDKSKVQSMRNQADWLLHNIIPRHVAEQLKSTAKYSENHRDVGIIFASIVNFNEMYDESYLRGKEYLRVLNELIADFDELLERPEFRSVEKIKTIGSTFMAASGLNPRLRRGSDHLHALLDFATAMQDVIDSFNRDLLEFDLILRVGYNSGDVTAGVIGTTKLYYDIWGDAVNIASRMDSTGVPGRVQLGEACLPPLLAGYEFEPRGSVYVKGKDHMNVYLLVGKRPSPSEGPARAPPPPPPPSCL